MEWPKMVSWMAFDSYVWSHVILHDTSNRSRYFVKRSKDHVKYTNPARGILDFCKQKFCRPLLCRQWTRGPHNIYKLNVNQPSADFSRTERKKKKKKKKNMVKP